MENNKRNDEKDQHKRKITAAELDALTGSPTQHERSKRAGGDLGNTGTNVSYEGPTSTSPVGTGYNSGQSGTGADIRTDSEDAARTSASTPREKDSDERSEDRKNEDTIGNP